MPCPSTPPQPTVDGTFLDAILLVAPLGIQTVACVQSLCQISPLRRMICRGKQVIINDGDLIPPSTTFIALLCHLLHCPKTCNGWNMIAQRWKVGLGLERQIFFFLGYENVLVRQSFSFYLFSLTHARSTLVIVCTRPAFFIVFLVVRFLAMALCNSFCPLLRVPVHSIRVLFLQRHSQHLCHEYLVANMFQSVALIKKRFTVMMKTREVVKSSSP